MKNWNLSRFSKNSKKFIADFQELRDGRKSFEDFVDDGLIEYLDVNEMNDAQIAVYEREIKPITTHLEVSREKSVELGKNQFF